MEILNADAATLRFMEEWNSGCDYLVAHTSGSTGEPKEILLPRGDMLHSAQATCEFFDLTSSSVLLSPLSADYIAGKMMIVRAAVADCRLWVEPPSNQPVKQDYGTIDLLPIVPSQVQWLLDNADVSSRLRNVIVGGAPVSNGLERLLVDAPFKCYATYGMTETCSHVALREMGIPYFSAMPGVEFEVNTDGQLVIIADGYSFGELVTNDIVELRSSTQFRWLGRKDNVIISGGVKLHPEEIEKEISPLISVPFYLIGERSEKWGESLVLYVESLDFDAAALVASMKNVLHPFKMPKEVRLKKEFARTASGKVIRKLL